LISEIPPSNRMKLPSNRILITALAVIAILFALSFAMKSEGFEGGSANAPTFTMYYADWCPHCVKVKPSFKKFSENGSVTVKGKTVFVSMVEEKEITSDVKVKGFPTFVLKKADGSTVESDADRTPDGWKQWLGENV
jgi:thiol-disulfide isomerase/thioredoxin